MNKGSRVRVFIGVGVEATDELSSLLTRLGDVGPEVRPTVVEQLHVTLRFVGDVDLDEVPALCTTVQQVGQKFSQTEVDLVSVDAFPTRTEAEVLWVGVSPTEQFIDAAKLLTKKLEPLGIAPEARTFRPHLTVARLRLPAPRLAVTTQAAIDDLFASTTRFGTAAISTVRLYQSKDEGSPSNRSTYRILHEAD